MNNIFRINYRDTKYFGINVIYKRGYQQWNNNDIPMQSIVKSRNATVPVFLEIGLDRVLIDLSERSVAHVLRFAWSSRNAVVDFVDLELIISATRAHCEEYEERNNQPHPLTILLDRLSQVVEKTSSWVWSVGRGQS